MTTMPVRLGANGPRTPANTVLKIMPGKRSTLGPPFEEGERRVRQLQQAADNWTKAKPVREYLPAVIDGATILARRRHDHRLTRAVSLRSSIFRDTLLYYCVS